MNKDLGGLNDRLYETMDRLLSDDLTEEELDREIKRATAVTGVAQQVIATGSLALKAKEASESIFRQCDVKLPPMLSIESRKK